MKIGEKIKELRLKHHLTQEELAGRVELSKGFISQIERDLTSPSIATLIDILQCLGTDLKEFFTDWVEGYRFMAKFRQGGWSGKISVMASNNTLPFGLLFETDIRSVPITCTIQNGTTYFFQNNKFKFELK